MNNVCKEEFVEVSDGVKLYTIVLLPDAAGKYPIMFVRDPYQSRETNTDRMRENYAGWLNNGYAVVFQHCRGSGKSEGDFLPYINERRDGLETLDWIRKQSFYAGEIYPVGTSYSTSVHLLYLDTKPHDVKGCVLNVQDCNRYNIVFRNGFLKFGLHVGWFIGNYKKNGNIRKRFTEDTYRTLPLSDFTKTIYGESVPLFDKLLEHPTESDGFWKTKEGGYDSYNALKDADIPILLTTGFYDIYTEGIFEMWDGIKPENKKRCAFVVTPYDHSAHYNNNIPIKFENGGVSEAEPDYALRWINHIRNGGELNFIREGKTSYYTLFKNEWRHEDKLTDGSNELDLYLNKQELSIEQKNADEITYMYNPFAPARFQGGVCHNFGGMQIQDETNSRYDIISFLSQPFERDMHIKGKAYADLYVKSDCEDTCFYVRTSIVKNGKAYSLRDDITSISYQHGEYTPGSEVTLNFKFAPHSFLIEKGDMLRVDISSSAFPHFNAHSNNKGSQYEQKTAKIAHNTIICGKSKLQLFYE